MGFRIPENITLTTLEPRPDTVGKMLDRGIPVAVVLRAEAGVSNAETSVDIVAFKDLPADSSKTEKMADFYSDDNFSIIPLRGRRDLRGLGLKAARSAAKAVLTPSESDPTVLTTTVNIPN